MAAIIAQMSMRNRERKKRKAMLGKRAEVSSDKCVYELQPFDRCYDPIIHNKYLRSKIEIEKRNVIIKTAKCEYNCCKEVEPIGGFPRPSQGNFFFIVTFI